jgi:formate dehydrogenase
MQEDKWDQPLLAELCDVMQDSSICGLGQAAPNPILLTMKHFQSEIS